MPEAPPGIPWTWCNSPDRDCGLGAGTPQVAHAQSAKAGGWNDNPCLVARGASGSR